MCDGGSGGAVGVAAWAMELSEKEAIGVPLIGVD
jgi:hypothetical protein